jgi:hypothetical protein
VGMGSFRTSPNFPPPLTFPFTVLHIRKYMPSIENAKFNH